MSDKSNLKKNILYQTFYEILIIILPLFTSPYISRVLGADGLGTFSYTYSIAYYFQLLGMLGIKFYGNRCIARIRDNQNKVNENFSELLVIHIVFSLFSCLLYVLYCRYFAIDKTNSYWQGLMVIATIFDISWLFFGLEKFRLTVSINSVVKLISVALIFTFVHNADDLYIYIAIMAGAQLLSQITMCIYAKRYVSFRLPKFTNLLTHIKPLFYLFIPVIAVSLFKYMDKIMLGFLGNIVDLGYYENADKILNIPLSIIVSFGSVMLPKMSNLVYKEKSDMVDYYMEMSIKYMMCVSFAMAFGMAGISKVFSNIFWGNEFDNCSLLIKLLAITIPFSTLASIIRNQVLIPYGKDKYYTYAILVGAVSNLIINWLLIPKYQAIGVALGTIISEVLVCIVQLLLTHKEHNYKNYIKSSIYFVIPGIIMFLFIRLLEKTIGIKFITLILQIFLGGIIYIIISLIMFYKSGDKQLIYFLKEKAYRLLKK